MESNDIPEKIIRVLAEKGPSLPITISKQVGMNSLFISAFLSELANKKRIKISHLKVGGSPLYFLEGQDPLLENFYDFLHPKEAETFLLLKKKKLLKDSEQEPATRVALRSIRDFAIGFKKDDEIYWRYTSVPEKEVKELIKPKKTKKQAKKIPAIVPKQKKQKSFQTPKYEFQNPLVMQTKKKRQKVKSEFILKIINFLENNYKILQERGYKAKEYNCIIQIKSDLGPVNFLTQIKDKKTVSETDLKKLLSEAQLIPLPAFFLHTGKLSKKAQEYAKKYYSILKVLKIQ